MKPAPFDYFAPTSVDEVRDRLAQYGDDAKILAGGQSLVPVMALRLAQPSVVIDINHVRELDYIRADAHGLTIGAITRHRAVERSTLVREKAPLLSAGESGSAIRRSAIAPRLAEVSLMPTRRRSYLPWPPPLRRPSL